MPRRRSNVADAVYLDDLSVGDSFETGTHEMTADDIVAFARQFDPQPFHTDPNAAEQSLFGGLAASGWHTAAVTMRLVVEAMPLARGMIGTEATTRWPTPTRPGDVLKAVATIEDIAESKSKPGMGNITVMTVTTNQHGEVRQEFRSKVLAWKRPAA